MKALRCIAVEDDEGARKALNTLIQRTDLLQMVGEACGPTEALSLIRQQQPELIFLDIEMPEMNGLEMLGTLEEQPQVVITSGNRHYAVDAFEHNVTDYLVKPLGYERFLKAVMKARQLQDLRRLNQDPEASVVFIKADNRIVKLDLRNLHYVEAMADYATLYTPEERYIIHSTMKALAIKLPSPPFFRIHRSYILNLDHLQAIEDNHAYVLGKALPIGASYREALLSQLRFF